MSRTETMKKITLFLLLLTMFLMSPHLKAVDPRPPNIEGIYSIIGAEKGNHYTGTATIRKYGPDSYLVQSSIATLDDDGEPAGAHSSIGISFHHGDTLS